MVDVVETTREIIRPDSRHWEVLVHLDHYDLSEWVLEAHIGKIELLRSSVEMVEHEGDPNWQQVWVEMTSEMSAELPVTFVTFCVALIRGTDRVTFARWIYNVKEC